MLGKSKRSNPNCITITKIDTIRIEKPTPIKVETIKKVYVPVPITDTITQEIVKMDSVLVSVDIERKTYQDSTYKAVVTGAVVGDVHPTLESIEVYNKKETTIIEKPLPTINPYISASFGKDALGFGGGVFVKGKLGLGARYMRVDNNNMIVGEITWKF